MIIALILLAVALCITVGYAARQKQDLRENAVKIELGETLLRDQAFKYENMLSQREFTIENLHRENNDLRREKGYHETSLEMLLAELEPKREVAV